MGVFNFEAALKGNSRYILMIKHITIGVLFLGLLGCGRSEEGAFEVISDNVITLNEIVTEEPEEPEKQYIWLEELSIMCDIERVVNDDITYGDVLDYVYNLDPESQVDLSNYNLTFAEELEIFNLFADKNYLYHFVIPVGDQLIDSEMTEINISEIMLTDIEGFDIDTFISMMPYLTRIEMCNCGYTNEEMAAICDAHEDIRIIWEVHLEYWTFRTDIVAFTSDKTCADDFFMENDDARYLKYCTDLKALDLGHNHVNDFSFLNELTDLRILIVVDNVLYERPDKSQHHIESYCLEPLYNLTELRYLEIFSNAITDISFINNMPKLMDVNISYNPIYDISPLFNHPRLKRIWLESIKASEGQIASLYASYPGSKIVVEGEGSIDQGWRDNEDYYAMRRTFHNNEIDPIFMND